MTFKKYVGKKTIFAIITLLVILLLHIRTGDILDPPFPFLFIIPAFALAWIGIIINFAVRYARKSHVKS